ncbi:unnamed protein product [Lampetra planeri]
MLQSVASPCSRTPSAEHLPPEPHVKGRTNSRDARDPLDVACMPTRQPPARSPSQRHTHSLRLLLLLLQSRPRIPPLKSQIIRRHAVDDCVRRRVSSATRQVDQKHSYL